MIYYVHQLVANWVCLLFSAEQVVYSVILFIFDFEVVWVNQNSKVSGQTT